MTETSSPPRRQPRASRGGVLGVRTVPNDPIDVRLQARAFIGVTLAARYDSREEANTGLAAYPARHTPTPRRPGLST